LLETTNKDDTLKDIEKRHINYECVPVIVDLEQGWRLSHLTSAAVQKLIQQGVNIVHIEDQDLDKRCGHLGGKVLASLDGWVKYYKQHMLQLKLN